MHLLRIECKNNVENILERMKFDNDRLILKGTEHVFQNLGQEKFPAIESKNNKKFFDRQTVRAVTTKEEGPKQNQYQKQSSLTNEKGVKNYQISPAEQSPKGKNHEEPSPKITKKGEDEKQPEIVKQSINSMIEKEGEEDGDFYNEDFQSNPSHVKSKDNPLEEEKQQSVEKNEDDGDI